MRTKRLQNVGKHKVEEEIRTCSPDEEQNKDPEVIIQYSINRVIVLTDRATLSKFKKVKKGHK